MSNRKKYLRENKEKNFKVYVINYFPRENLTKSPVNFLT